MLYKAIIKHIWTYSIQLWGCTKPYNSQIIQHVQSKILRMIYNVPWYVSNKTLHESSTTPLVEDQIHRLTQHYLCKLSGHANQLVHQLHTPQQLKDAYVVDGQRTLCPNHRITAPRHNATPFQRPVVGRRLPSPYSTHPIYL